ncbi:MAG: nicotinate (nicotinamide) nucleotide adenylyltransferase [Lentisphaeria bacterium]
MIDTGNVKGLENIEKSQDAIAATKEEVSALEEKPLLEEEKPLLEEEKPLLEEEKPVLKEEPEPLPPQRNYRLVIFGGSFDPVHNGHLQLAEKILELGYGDEIMFVPALYPNHPIPKKLVSADHRLKMLQLAIEDNENLSYTDMELQRTDRKSYSIDTMELIGKIYPDYELLFLMGMDSLKELRSWYRSAELVSHYRFLIYPRPNVMPVPYSELLDVFGAVNARKLIGSILQDENLPVWDISSSDLRNACREGGDLSSYVPPKVWQYITDNKLYI